MKQVILRDGVKVAEVEDAKVLGWFHANTIQSMDWALAHEGYSLGDPEPSKAELVRDYERQTTGSQDLHRHWAKSMLFTDGMLYLADTCGAHWLIDVVASHQKPITSKFSREEVAFQVWEIRQGSKPGSWEITAWTDTPRADESKRLAHQVIEYSDFPEDLAPFQFYLESGVCMLKGER